jgi:hypothetical protein
MPVQSRAPDPPKTVAQQEFSRAHGLRVLLKHRAWVPQRARMYHAATAGTSPASWPCRFDPGHPPDPADLSRDRLRVKAIAAVTRPSSRRAVRVITEIVCRLGGAAPSTSRYRCQLRRPRRRVRTVRVLGHAPIRTKCASTNSFDVTHHHLPQDAARARRGTNGLVSHPAFAGSSQGRLLGMLDISDACRRLVELENSLDGSVTTVAVV